MTEIEKQKSFRRIKLFSFRKEWEEYFLAYVDCKTGELHKEEGRIAFPVTDTENLPYQFEDETIYSLS